MTREELQAKAVDLSIDHPNLLLSWPTGTGKGLGIMKCILASKSKKKWLIVVPELVQIENWWADVRKWDLEAQISPKIEDVICYASLKKWVGRAINLALNECHRLSEARGFVVEEIEYEKLLMDTATMPPEVRDRLPTFYEYKLSMKQVVEWGILPAPEIQVHYVELSRWPKIYPVKLRSGKNAMYDAYSYYTHLTSNFKYWQNRAGEEGHAWQMKKMFLSAMNRKRWIAEYKTGKAKDVLKLVENQRFIAFCGSVKQAKELGGKQAVHAKNKNNQQLIDDFNNLKTSSLYACGMMKEGMNLEQIEAGLVVQLDSKDLGNIQRLGRILRSDYPELHLICVRGTKDEDYLKNFLKSIK